MESGINAFVSQVDAFLSGGWHGQASEAYKPPFEDWATNAKKAQQALQTMAELLGSSAEDYDHQEQSNDELINTIHVEQSKMNW